MGRNSKEGDEKGKTEGVEWGREGEGKDGREVERQRFSPVVQLG